MSAAIRTWQERMPAPRAAFYCSMNCSGVGMHAIRDDDCGDCGSTTVHGDPIAARDAEIAELRTALAAKAEGLADARNLVPGKMHCARCRFSLIRKSLYVQSGTVGAGGSETEPCPNGCGPLWPITWEQEARDCYKLMDDLFERTKKAEDALKAAPAMAVETAACAWAKISTITGQINGVTLTQDCELRSQKLAPLGLIMPAVQQGGDADREAIINRLWEQSNHGTRREDVVRIYDAGAKPAAAHPPTGDGWRELGERAIKVLQSHIVPGGISDKEALSRIYSIFDGLECNRLLAAHPLKSGEPGVKP